MAKFVAVVCRQSFSNGQPVEAITTSDPEDFSFNLAKYRFELAGHDSLFAARFDEEYDAQGEAAKVGQPIHEHGGVAGFFLK